MLCPETLGGLSMVYSWLRLIVLGLTFILLGVNSSLGQTVNYEEFTIRVDSLLALETAPDAPGAAVVVIEHGRPIYKGTFGLASLEYKVPITGATVFNLASVSKQFTAMAILILEKEGKVSLQDDIHEYFPELPDYGAPVTLDHLLHHTSGLWEYSTMFLYYGGHNPVDYNSLEDIIALLKGQKELLFEPGSQWQYSNTNYALLGGLITRVTGESVVSWTQTHIFEPLGMKSTGFQENYLDVIPSMAGCYRKTGDHYRREPRNSDVSGPSYLYSSIDDMALWLDNFRHGTVGGDSLISRLFQRNVLNDGTTHYYGFGLGVSEDNGKTIISHSGKTGGFKSHMKYVREDEVGIAILSNNRGVDAETLTGQILDLYYGRSEREEDQSEVFSVAEPPPFISIDSVETEGLGGAYTVESAARRVLIARLSSCLYCIFDGRGTDAFYPISDSEFTNRSRNVSFVVHRNDTGEPVRLMLDIKGDTLWASRTEPPTMTGDQLTAEYAGTYYCDALDIAYRVTVDEDKLVIRHHRYSDRSLQPTDRDEFVGGIGIVRFSRDEQGKVDGFGLTDEDLNFKPLEFERLILN